MFGRKKYKILFETEIDFYFKESDNKGTSVGSKGEEKITQISAFRIQALRDIPRHGVKAGDIGGYVSDKNCLSHKGDSWIGGDAFVSSVDYDAEYFDGKPSVRGHAIVTGNATARNSVITQNALVGGHSSVKSSIICGNSQAVGSSFIEDSLVRHNGKVVESARISKSLVSFNSIIFGEAKIHRSLIADFAKISGKARVEYSIVANEAQIKDSVTVTRSLISEKAHCSGQALIADSVVTDAAIVQDKAVVHSNKISGNSQIIKEAKLPKETTISYGVIEDMVPAGEYSIRNVKPPVVDEVRMEIPLDEFNSPKFTASRATTGHLHKYRNVWENTSATGSTFSYEVAMNAHEGTLEEAKKRLLQSKDILDKTKKSLAEHSANRSINAYKAAQARNVFSTESYEEALKAFTEESRRAKEKYSKKAYYEKTITDEFWTETSSEESIPQHSEEFNHLVATVEEIEKAYESYTLDIVKLLKYPLMADASVPEVGRLIYRLRAAKRAIGTNDTSKLSEAVEELDMAFIQAEGVVQTAARSQLDPTKRKKVETAEQMLLLALDKGSTDNEKKVSFKAGIKALEGVLPLKEEAIDNLRNKAGLLAIES